MRTRTLVPAILVGAFPATAQLGTGTLPHGWQPGIPEEEGLPEFVLPVQVPAEDTLPAGFRWGWPVEATIDVGAEALWTALPDGGLLGRLVLRSPGAVGLAVQFDQWDLPPGAEVHLHDIDRRKAIGGFTAANRGPDGTMATEQLPGEALVIAYRLPPGSAPGGVRVSGATHAIKDLTHLASAAERDFWPGFPAAPCHINTACPEAADWQAQKRGVVMFIRPDGGGCSASLINNTAVPGRPLVYLAAHCYQPNTSQWVFYFNYEAPLCVGDTGSTAHTLTGATALASDYYSDFGLVELFTAPPAEYQPYYLGWDRSGDVPQSGTVVHHPHYDVKKITFDHDPATTWVDGEGFVMWRQFWDQGLVESVSSGAPLLDQNKRIVGHMATGAQDCATATTVPTGCVKFTEGWDGPTPASRKWDWLDPANTTVQLDGHDPYASAGAALRPRMFLEGPYDPVSGLMDDALRAGGLVPLQEPYTALGYAHVGGGGETTAPAVLAAGGPDAIVDWVTVELRSTADPAMVLATRSALLQRDGDVVGTDGAAAVQFPVAAGTYRVAVRHRNHLGIMSAGGIALDGTPAAIDLSDGSVPLFGGAEAAKAVGGRLLLYAGDVRRDNVLRYLGMDNDRDPVLVAVGGTVPTGTIAGYHVEDVNMDGVVKYTGPSNDREVILLNIGGAVPTNVRPGSLP
ncbi:MAG: hypothetical protein RBT71_07565 [Flavobacteriales bacterium]|jgi:hypothetical protein|nr:hypothetical protein [Flavobacteriales bacterium]